MEEQLQIWNGVIVPAGLVPKTTAAHKEAHSELGCAQRLVEGIRTLRAEQALRLLLRRLDTRWFCNVRLAQDAG